MSYETNRWSTTRTEWGPWVVVMRWDAVSPYSVGRMEPVSVEVSRADGGPITPYELRQVPFGNLVKRTRLTMNGIEVDWDASLAIAEVLPGA